MGGGGGGGNRHKKVRSKRMGVAQDMTAMVDVAFLLLTFFILTSAFSQPQAMEITLPEPNTETLTMAESNVFQLRVEEDGTVWYGTGTEPLKKTTIAAIAPVLKANANRSNKTATVLKVDEKGKYSYAIDLLDEFNLNNVVRFAIAPLTDQDRALIAAAKTQTGG